METILTAPLLVALPVGVAQPLAGELRIVLGNVFLRLFHRREEDHLVGQPLIDDQMGQSVEVAHVVVVDAGCPLEFDDGKDTFLDTDGQILGHGADVTRVGDTAAGLGVLFGLQLGQGGIGNGEIAAQAVGGLVMADDIEAVFGHTHVTLQSVIAVHVDAVAIGLGSILNPDVAAAMAHKQRFPCPNVDSKGQHHQQGKKSSIHRLVFN